MAASSIDEFRVTDPELPFIAASAAAEVDNLIHGRNGNITNVTRLSALLRNSVSHQDTKVHPVRSLMDPVSTDVFSRAFSASHDCHINSVDELASKVEELASELAGVKTRVDILEILKKFCVELSRHALATRYYIHQSRTKNPYKK